MHRSQNSDRYNFFIIFLQILFTLIFSQTMTIYFKDTLTGAGNLVGHTPDIGAASWASFSTNRSPVLSNGYATFSGVANADASIQESAVNGLVIGGNVFQIETIFNLPTVSGTTSFSFDLQVYGSGGQALIQIFRAVTGTYVAVQTSNLSSQYFDEADTPAAFLAGQDNVLTFRQEYFPATSQIVTTFTLNSAAPVVVTSAYSAGFLITSGTFAAAMLLAHGAYNIAASATAGIKSFSNVLVYNDVTGASFWTGLLGSEQY